MIADPENSRAVRSVNKQIHAVRCAARSASGVLGQDAEHLQATLGPLEGLLDDHRAAQLTSRTLVDLALLADTDGATGFTLGRLHATELALAGGAVDDFVDRWRQVGHTCLPTRTHPQQLS